MSVLLLAVVTTIVYPAEAMRVKDACPVTKGYGFDANPHPGNVVVTTVVGNGNSGLVDADAPASAHLAELNSPRFLLFHAETGTLYISDSSNHRIRTMSSAGAVTTLAGKGAGSRDGTFADAEFRTPAGLAFDYDCNELYVADDTDDVIRRLTFLEINRVTTAAGKFGASGFNDATDPTAAKFDRPRGLIYAAKHQSLYIADNGNHRIRTLGSTNAVSTLATSVRTSDIAYNVFDDLLYGFDSDADEIYTIALATGVKSVVMPSSEYVFGIAGDFNLGTVFVTFGNSLLSSSGGAPDLVAGDTTASGLVNANPPSNSRFDKPRGLAIDPHGGGIYIADEDNHVIRGIAGVVSDCTGRVPAAPATAAPASPRVCAITRTESPSRSATATISLVPTRTATATWSRSTVPSGTLTPSYTATATRSISTMPTGTSTFSATSSVTSSTSVSRSASRPTVTGTRSETSTPSRGPTRTSTVTPPATDTQTASRERTSTATLTSTVSRETPTAGSVTSSASWTWSTSQSVSLSASRPPTASATVSLTVTPPATETATLPPTPTHTVSATTTASSTLSIQPPPYVTPTRSATLVPPARLRVHAAGFSDGVSATRIAGGNGTVFVNVSSRLDGLPIRLQTVYLVPVNAATGADDAMNPTLAAPTAAWVRLGPNGVAVNFTCATLPSWSCAAHNITVPTTAVGGEYAVEATLLFAAATAVPTQILPELFVRVTPPPLEAAFAELVSYSFEALRRDRFVRSMCVTLSLRDAAGAALPLWIPSPAACVEIYVNGTSSACRTLPKPQDTVGRSLFEMCGFPVPTSTAPEYATPLAISAVVRNVNAGVGTVTTSVRRLAAMHDTCGGSTAVAVAALIGPFATATPWARFVDVPAPVLAHAAPSHHTIRACLLGRNTSVPARRIDNCTVRCAVPAGTAVFPTSDRRRAGVAFETSSAGVVARTPSVLDVTVSAPLFDSFAARITQEDGPAGIALVVGTSRPFSHSLAHSQAGVCVTVEAPRQAVPSTEGYRLRVEAEAGGRFFIETAVAAPGTRFCNATRSALRHASTVGSLAAPSLHVTVTLVAPRTPPAWPTQNLTLATGPTMQIAHTSAVCRPAAVYNASIHANATMTQLRAAVSSAVAVVWAALEYNDDDGGQAFACDLQLQRSGTSATAEVELIDACAIDAQAPVRSPTIRLFDAATNTTSDQRPVTVHGSNAAAPASAMIGVSGCALDAWPRAVLCAEGDVLSIAGTSLGATSSVRIHPSDWTPVECHVTAVTETLVTCALPRAPRGSRATVALVDTGNVTLASSYRPLVDFALPPIAACFFTINNASAQLCSGNGVCDDAVQACRCASSENEGFWSGERCDTCDLRFNGSESSGCRVACPSNTSDPCSGHGVCSNGTCVSCELGWVGDTCAQLCPSHIPGASCNAGASDGASCLQCGGHGTCDGTTGVCSCNTGYCGGQCATADPAACLPCPASGFYGASCDLPCPGGTGSMACSSHGLCSDGKAGDGTCTCSSGYTAQDCGQVCPGGTTSPCNGHGRCDSTTGGACVCDANYGGVDCSAVCPGAPANTCAGHGLCTASAAVGAVCFCERGYAGAGCDTLCPGGAVTPCNNRGTCQTSNATCSCLSSPSSGFWAGAACDECQPEWHGALCDVQCGRGANGLQCSGNGICGGDAVCRCSRNTSHVGFWSGELCDVCAPGYHGPNCTDECAGGACSACSDHGTCADGLDGDGQCTCFANATHGFWIAPDCADCADGVWGPACRGLCPTTTNNGSIGAVCGGHGYCSQGIDGDGTCRCDAGWRIDSSSGVCSECAAGFFGPACDACTAFDATACSGHGSCADGATGDGTCACVVGFYGSQCNASCPFDASGGGVCGGHGTCDRDAGCICDSEWVIDGAASTGCVLCVQGRYGSDCAGACPDCGTNGACDAGVSGTGACVCTQGFYGDACELQCPTSAVGTAICNGHGTCGSSGCTCFANFTHGFWAGASCDGCATGFAGDVCTGQCPTWSGSVCNSGRGACTAVINASDAFECSSCQPLPTDADRLWCGRSCEQSGASCLDFEQSCPAGFWGPICAQRCPGALADGSNACHGRGVCNTDTGVCICDAGASLDDCSGRCPAAVVGRHLYVCAGHGACGRDDTACRCQSGWWGAACASECPGGASNPCFGAGVCDSLTGECVCVHGFAGRECDVPCPGGTANPCHGHGECQRDVSCTCEQSTANGRWAGLACDRCTDGYGGGDCTLRCTAGTPTNGTECLCSSGVAGRQCHLQCPGRASIAGVCSGNGICSDGALGDATCTCAAGWFGAPCDVSCSADRCRADQQLQHPACDAATGACVCARSLAEGYWAGEQCDECESGRWGPTCQLACACNGHGSCDRNTGECSCFRRDDLGYWAGTYCEQCSTGYIGVDCRGPNIELSPNAARSLRVTIPVDAAARAETSVLFIDPLTGLVFAGSSPVVVVNASVEPPAFVGSFSSPFGQPQQLAEYVVPQNETHLTVGFRQTTQPSSSNRLSASIDRWNPAALSVSPISATTPESVSRRQLLQASLASASSRTVPVFTSSRAAAPDALITFATTGTTSVLQIEHRQSPDDATTATFAVDLSQLLQAITGVRIENGTAHGSPGQFRLVVYGSAAGEGGWLLAAARWPLSAATTHDDFDRFNPRNVASGLCPALRVTSVLQATPPWCTEALFCALHGARMSRAACVVRREGGGAVVIGFPIDDATGPTADATSLWLRSTGSQLTLTAGGVDASPDMGIAYVALHAPDEPSRLYKWRLDRFTLTGILELTTIRGEHEVCTGLVVAPATRELRVAITTGNSVELRSLNTFGVRGVSPQVIDAAGGTVVTATGEGFTSALGAVTCDFSLGGQPTPATVVDNATLLCRAPPAVAAGSDGCVQRSFNVRVAGRVTATSNVVVRRPVSARVLAANASSTLGAYSRSGSEGVVVTLSGRGFVLSESASCQLAASPGAQAATTFSQGNVTFVDTTRVLCHLPSWVAPTRPPTSVSYSHDGTVFASVRAPFAVVGDAAGLAIRSPANGVVVRSAAIAALPDVVAHVVDRFDNSLLTTDRVTPQRTFRVSVLYEASDAAATLQQSSGGAAAAVLIRDGVGIARGVALVAPVVGRIIVRATLVDPAAAGQAWSADALLSVTVGSPAKIALVNANATSTWLFGALNSRRLEPSPVAIITDAAGTPVRDDTSLPRQLVLSYIVTERNIVSTTTADDSVEFNDRVVTHRAFVTGTAEYVFGDVEAQGVHGRAYSVRIEQDLSMANNATTGAAQVTPYVVNSVHVLPCQANEYAVSGTDQCSPCPDLALCDGTSQVQARSGVWRASKSTMSFYTCDAPENGRDACRGEAECDAGHTGPRCDVCAEGYGSNGSRCSRCDSSVLNWLRVIALALFVLFATWGMIRASTFKTVNEKKLSGLIKMFLSHLQLLATVRLAGTSAPDYVTTLYTWADVASAFSPAFAFMSCEVTPTFYELWLVMSVAPWVLVAIFVVEAAVRTLVFRQGASDLVERKETEALDRLVDEVLFDDPLTMAAAADGAPIGISRAPGHMAGHRMVLLQRTLHERDRNRFELLSDGTSPGAEEPDASSPASFASLARPARRDLRKSSTLTRNSVSCVEPPRQLQRKRGSPSNSRVFLTSSLASEALSPQDSNGDGDEFEAPAASSVAAAPLMLMTPTSSEATLTPQASVGVAVGAGSAPKTVGRSTRAPRVVNITAPEEEEEEPTAPRGPSALRRKPTSDDDLHAEDSLRSSAAASPVGQLLSTRSSVASIKSDAPQRPHVMAAWLPATFNRMDLPDSSANVGDVADDDDAEAADATSYDALGSLLSSVHGGKDDNEEDNNSGAPQRSDASIFRSTSALVTPQSFVASWSPSSTPAMLTTIFTRRLESMHALSKQAVSSRALEPQESGAPSLLSSTRATSADLSAGGAPTPPLGGGSTAAVVVPPAQHQQQRPPPPAAAQGGKVRGFIEAALTNTLIVLFLLFPTLVGVNGEMQRCEDIDLGPRQGTISVLVADRAINCGTAEHTRYANVALGLFFMYVLLVPGAVVAVIKVHACATGSMLAARKAFFFLTGGLAANRWFWEGWVTTRKAVLVIIGLFIRDELLRIYASMWFLGACVVVSHTLRPFVDARVARLEMLSTGVLFVTFSLSLLFDKVDHDSNTFVALGAGVFAINAVVVACFVFGILYVAYVVVLEALRDRGYAVRIPEHMKIAARAEIAEDADGDDDSNNGGENGQHHVYDDDDDDPIEAVEKRTKRLEAALKDLREISEFAAPHKRMQLLRGVIVAVAADVDSKDVLEDARLQQSLRAYEERAASAVVRLTGFNSSVRDIEALFAVERGLLEEVRDAHGRRSRARIAQFRSKWVPRWRGAKKSRGTPGKQEKYGER